MKKTVEESNIDPASEKCLRDRCVSFILHLGKQLQQRLPHNINILENISLLSVSNTLKVVKDTLIPLMEMMNIDVETIGKINVQWNNITNFKWLEKTNTHSFWYEVSKYRDSSDTNPFFELSEFALKLLVLKKLKGFLAK